MKGWDKLNAMYVRQPTGEVNHAIVMLHGAYVGFENGGALTSAEHIQETGETFLDYADRTGLMIVCPESGSYTLDGVLQNNWDVTSHFHYGLEITDLVNTIKYIQAITPTVWLHGGSGGGFMAWRVAIELDRMSQIDSIYGLICTECTSPFGMSINDSPPPAFNGCHCQYDYSIFGYDSYICDDPSINLGLPSKEAKFYKQMLYQYSPDDVLIPSRFKENFATSLMDVCTSLTVKTSGSEHNLGQQGWVDLVEWLTEKDKKTS